MAGFFDFEKIIYDSVIYQAGINVNFLNENIGAI